MAVKVVDSVVETTQTTGTGTLDLDGAQPGFRSFADELTSGDQVYYCIEDDPSSPTAYEIGIGTFTAGSPNTLSRDTVLKSSTGNKLNLVAGGYTVTGVLPAAALALYALLGEANTFTTNQTIDRSGAAAAMNVGSDQSSGVVAELQLFGRNSGGSGRVYAEIEAQVVNATAGSEDSRINFRNYRAGNSGVGMYLQDGLVMAGVSDDKGAGTINAVALYRNGAAVLPIAVVRLTGLNGTPTITAHNGGLGTLSATRNGTGDYTVSWGTALTNPMVECTVQTPSTTNSLLWSIRSSGLTGTSVRVIVMNVASVAVDPEALTLTIYGSI